MNSFLLFQNNFKMFLPEVFLATCILILVLHGSILVSAKEIGSPFITRSLNKLSVLVLFFTFFLVQNSNNIFISSYQGGFIFDNLASNSKQLILLCSLICLLISEDYIFQNKLNRFEYFLLFLSSILGLLFVVCSNDLISLYLSIEMQSLCFFVLAASKKDSSFSVEAGLKYFILGSFSSAFFLLGISLLYGCTGTTNFDNLHLLFLEKTEETSFIFSPIENGLICISVAFFFKLGVSPFHFWVPDVYEGSPTSISLFFAITPKIVLFIAFLRLFQGVFISFSEFLYFVILLFAILSIFVGSFVALRQKKLKRLLAYSSINHVGYLLLAFSANSLEATESLFFYIFIYMFTSFGLWSILLLIDKTYSFGKSKTLLDLASVAKTNPLIGVSCILALFSLAGIPPFAGFLAKIEIFINALNASLFSACLFALLASVISAFYYVRLVKVVYFEKCETQFFLSQINPIISITLTLSTFSLVFFFINPCFLQIFAQKMALCLF
jgi:NADH-quinone oxidoreductase subunit N